MPPSPETPVLTWNPPGSPAAVECAAEVLDEIRLAAVHGLQKLARGGIEEGGVLWGQSEGGRVFIMAMRLIECEHARGPGFLLSPQDGQGLRAALQKPDAELAGLVPVGYWVSHTRSEIQLNAGDLEIFNEFFPSPRQLVLVVKPSQHQPCRAGFFLRDTLGAVDGAKSLEEFDLRIRARTAAPPADRPHVVIPRREHPPEPPLSWLPAPDPPPAPPPPPATPARPPTAHPEALALPKFLTAEPPRPSRWPRFLWGTLLVVALLGGAAYAGRAYWQWRYPESLGLQVVEREGQLLIEWDRNSSLIRGAAQGVVQIRDADRFQSVPLDAAQLTSGSITFARKSADVEIKLSVPLEDGSTRQETTRFLGQPTAVEAEIERLRNRVRELEQRRGR